MAVNRRQCLTKAGQAALVAVAGARFANCQEGEKGSQRLSINRLKEWEALKYGMFIHYGINTFAEHGQYPIIQSPLSTYSPDNIDIDQWIGVARDAGMKYAVLTAKSGDGHCLWPSDYTDYTVANCSNKTDVVATFVKTCQKKGILPGLYYCSGDTHHLFGSQTRDMSKTGFMGGTPKMQGDALPPYTTSIFHNFMTAQLTELIERYGPIGEIWIDLPGELGWGYRTFIYNHLGDLQPDSITMMNSGTPTSSDNYDIAYAWPSDLIAIERGLPPTQGHQKWRHIKGKDYYVPAEICDTIGTQWYHRPPDPPRPDDVLAGILQGCLDRESNLLLDVPPSKDGLIPDEYVQALMRLRKNLNLA